MVFILGIIPARGGSKGVPKKNIAPVAGKPLIAYTIEAAKGSRHLDDCIVSTDSEEIARCAEQYGIRCETLRPANLATDDANSVDVVIYEIHQYERKHTITVDIIVILQPTTPLRTPSDIDHSVDMFLDTGAESLFSAYELTSMHPRNMFFLEGEFLTPVLTGGEYLRRRQDAKPVFMRNGALYLAKRSLVMDNHTLVGEKPRVYVMPRERSVNIDEPNDLILAEYQLKHQKSC